MTVVLLKFDYFSKLKNTTVTSLFGTTEETTENVQNDCSTG